MTIPDILKEFDELTETDIYAALSYAANRENRIYQIAVWDSYLIKFLASYFTFDFLKVSWSYYR